MSSQQKDTEGGNAQADRNDEINHNEINIFDIKNDNQDEYADSRYVNRHDSSLVIDSSNNNNSNNNSNNNGSQI